MEGRDSAVCRWNRLVKHREEYSGKEERRSRCGAHLDTLVYFTFASQEMG